MTNISHRSRYKKCLLINRLIKKLNLCTSLIETINLKHLWLNYKHIKSIPSEIGQLTALQELYLNNNQIASIPPEIGQLTALQGLYLSNNQMASIPSEIGQLSALQWLDFGIIKSHQYHRKLVN